MIMKRKYAFICGMFAAFLREKLNMQNCWVGILRHGCRIHNGGCNDGYDFIADGRN